MGINLQVNIRNVRNVRKGFRLAYFYQLVPGLSLSVPVITVSTVPDKKTTREDIVLPPTHLVWSGHVGVRLTGWIVSGHNPGCTCTSWALLKLRLKSRKSEVEGEGEGEEEDEGKEGLSEMQSPLPLNKPNRAAISDRRKEKRQNWKEEAPYPTNKHTHTPLNMLVRRSSVTFTPLTAQTPDFCNGKLNIHPSIHPSVYPNPHSPHTKADKQTDTQT